MSREVAVSEIASVLPAETKVKTLSGRERAYQASMRHFLGPLVVLMEDPSVSEIMVNGPKQIYVERRGQIEQAPLEFKNELELQAAANNIAQFVGRAVSEKEPILDGRMPDGSRICIVMDPISGAGTSINIRRFSSKAINPEFLIDVKSMTPEALEFALLCVQGALNVIVSGGTGSGKTTMLNILSNAFDDAERIVVVEDTRELQVQKQHVVNLEARPADAYGQGQITIRDLFVTSLRMRPDRIIVGEVRRGEALDMIQAMTSGHAGSMATLHADTPSGACGRLETMCMMADSGLPLAAIRRQIASAIDVVVQAARLHNGRRLTTHISEIDFDEPNNTYIVNDIFNLDTSLEFPVLKWTGRRPKLADEISWKGLTGHVKLTKGILGMSE
jgi:pilus assembly protein CpaF